MEAENRLDFDAAIATFDHPRSELVVTREVFEGEEQVRKYYATSRAAFPDQRNEIHTLRHADDTVVVEFDLLGTHLGSSPASNRPEVPSGVAWRRSSSSPATASCASGSTSIRRLCCTSSVSSAIAYEDGCVLLLIVFEVAFLVMEGVFGESIVISVAVGLFVVISMCCWSRPTSSSTTRSADGRHRQE